MESWPTPANMICALGPGESVVDIRTPGEYERWHGFRELPRDGLLCLDCLGAVNPRMLNKGTSEARPILVHSPRSDGANAEDRCKSVRSTQRGAGWKKLLKKKMGDYLHMLGHKVTLDPVTDGERIDLLTCTGSRRIAIRVELDKLKVEEFKKIQRQLAIQEKSTEVLWISFGCSWVDIANAVGIRFLEEPPANGIIDVGGIFPAVDAGIFVPSTQGFAPAKSVGLGYFLERFMAGSVQNHPIAGRRRGWARTNTWDHHIRHLVRLQEIAEQQRIQLEQELSEAKRAHRETSQALELKVTSADNRAARAERETNLERERAAAITDQQNVEIAHRIAATTWIDDVEKLRDMSIVGRFSLRRHLAFAYPPLIKTGSSETASNWKYLLRAYGTWVFAAATMILPLLGLIFLANVDTFSLPDSPWDKAILICLGLLPTGTALIINGKWCWALDNYSKVRGHRRVNGFMRSCGKPEHSLNIFDAWLLFCVIESLALVTWTIQYAA